MKAKKRINRDIKEIKENPLQGIGIESIEGNLFLYVVNMILMTGPYKGYCIQLLLEFFDNYPFFPPKILIFPAQALDGKYHHHIYDDEKKDENNLHYKKLCLDLQNNGLMEQSEINKEKTGWNPSYTISTLLLQIQNFLADPDMEIPNKNSINQLMKSMDTYKRAFFIINEKGIRQQIIHTWANPYPKMNFEPKENLQKLPLEKHEKEEEKNMKQIKEDLTCFILKENLIDNPDIILGYPIIYNNFIFIITIFKPIPELLSYDGFKAQIIQKYLDGQDVDDLFKSANNELYNKWLPIYINKGNYEKNKNVILKLISQVIQDSEFTPIRFFEKFPEIFSFISNEYLNEDKANLSSAFIKCFFQIILLFTKICQEYKCDLYMYLNNILENIEKNNCAHCILKYLQFLLYNQLDENTDFLNKIYSNLLKRNLILKMDFIFHSDKNKNKMKRLIFSSKKNLTIFEKFSKDQNYKMSNIEQFNKDIHQKNIYNEIIDVISNDKDYLNHIFFGKEKAKEITEKLFEQNFKKFLVQCSEEGKARLKDILTNNLILQDYFEPMQIKEDELYDSGYVIELLKDLNNHKIKEDIIKLAFKTFAKKDSLIAIFLIHKKINEKNFLEELEKNFGVYLEAENFINDLKDKPSKIETFKAFFEFIEVDLIKDEKEKTDKYRDDLELLMDMYQKAIENGFIEKKEIEHNLNDNNSIDDDEFLMRENNNNNNDDDLSISSNSVQQNDMKSQRINLLERDIENTRDRTRERERSRDRSRERERSRDRSRERERSRDRSRERERSRERDGNLFRGTTQRWRRGNRRGRFEFRFRRSNNPRI